MKKFRTQKGGYLLDEQDVLVDMWHNPVPREIFHTLGREWTDVQELARTEYLESLVILYKEQLSPNRQDLINLRDSFSKSELLDLYQHGKYLP